LTARLTIFGIKGKRWSLAGASARLLASALEPAAHLQSGAENATEIAIPVNTRGADFTSESVKAIQFPECALPQRDLSGNLPDS
jgi:hypothetical protein